jgi:hypothetical protein
MPTLRQKVDSFCKETGAEVGATDKLRGQIKNLKEELKKVKAAHKTELKEVKKTHKMKAAPKAKTQKVKPAPKPLPEPMLPAPTASVPVAAPSLAPAAPKGGRKTRRRPTMRW